MTGLDARDDERTSEGYRPCMVATPKPVAAGFRRLAALRSARAFHPVGRLGSGTLRIDDPATALGAALGVGAHAVRVRLSRGAGLPAGLPDFLGLAVRVEQAEPVDLLFTTTGRPGVLRWLVIPARRWTSRPYSTVLPYRGANGDVWLCLMPYGDWLPDGSTRSLDGVGVGRPLEFDVVEGRRLVNWRTVGRLVVESLADDEPIAFDPMLYADPRLRPVRFLSGVREAAYRGSRSGRPDGH